MFSNVFDTFIFDNEMEKHINTANVEGMFYSSILSGLHPTLSLNQAVDSPALHEILKNDTNSEFLKLVQNGTIRIARYKPKDDLIPDAIDAYIKPKLAGKKYCEFSSLPFLNENDPKYSEKQKANILKRLLDCYNTSDIIMETAFKNYADETDSLALFHWVNNLKSLRDAINDKYLPCPENIQYDQLALYNRVLAAIKTSIKYADNGFCLEELNAFEKHLKTEYSKGNVMGNIERDRHLSNLSSRSGMYRIIRDLKCAKSETDELKAMVDLCYNEIVAKSISDTEDDIMVNNTEIQYAQILLDTEDVLDKDQQRLALTKRAIKGDHSRLTWAALNDILHTVKGKCDNTNDPDKWYTIMQDTLKENGVKEITLKTNKLLLGRITFATSMASSIYGLLGKSSFGLALGAVSAGVSTLNMVFTRYQNKRDLEKSADKLLMYEQAENLLTQTALLKRNYNDLK